MTITLAPLFLATAIGVWPAGVARRRLRALHPARASPRRLRVPSATVAVPVLGGLAAWPILGPAGAAAAFLLTHLVRRTIHRRRDGRAGLAAADGIVEALRTLVAELRAGATAVTAAEFAAEDAPPTAAAALRSAAATVRLGGRAEFPLPANGIESAIGQIGRAWHLAARHGLPLADVLDAVRADMEQRVRFARHVDARMAGPRASATVLAALPVVALLLGQGSGAAPLAVLAGSATGQLLLLTGAVLVAAGLTWSERITRVDLLG